MRQTGTEKEGGPLKRHARGRQGKGDSGDKGERPWPDIWGKNQLNSSYALGMPNIVPHLWILVVLKDKE